MKTWACRHFPSPPARLLRHLPPLIRGGEEGWHGETADSACGLFHTASLAIGPAPSPPLAWADENVGLQPFPVPSSFVVRHLPPLLRGGQGGWHGETADSACGLSHPASLAIGPAPSPPLAPPYQGGESARSLRFARGDAARNKITTPASCWILAVVAVIVLLMPRGALGQLTSSEEEKLQILTDPEAVKKKLEKDKNKAPFEFFRSQVAPFDVLPYVKPFHWATLAMELRANDEDYQGYIQSDPVMMPSMPHEMVFRREARLLKEQRARLPLQVNLMQTVPKEWTLDLVRPGAIRPEGIWQASLLTLEPHQMLIMILSKESTNQFAAWNRLIAMLPSDAERESSDLEKQRYYRLVLPMDVDKPALSPHPLTWSTMSHVIWDGLPPDTLSVSQQQAMLDWLHWGGQIVFTGGAGQGYSLLRESFFGPYLPAEATGQTVSLSRDDLRPLSQSFPPPSRQANPGDQSEPVPATTEEAIRRFGAVIRPRPRSCRHRSVRCNLPCCRKPRLIDHLARRGESPFTCRRAAGGARARHDARDQSQRSGTAGMARARHADTPRRAAAAGRADCRPGWIRWSRVSSGAAQPSAGPRSELVSHHEPRRRPGSELWGSHTGRSG